MSTSSEIAAGRAYVELLLKDESFKTALKRASQTMEAWGKGLRKIGTGIAAAGAAMLSPFAASLPLFAKTGAKFSDLSQRIGAPTDDLQRLSFAANRSATSIEAITPGLIHFEKMLAKSGRSGKDLVGQLMSLADELGAIEDPAKRLEFMTANFGKAGAELIPLLAGGSAGLKRLFADADSLGLILDSRDIEAAARLANEFGELRDTLAGLGNVLAASIVPYLTPMVELASKATAITAKWISENRGAAVTLAAVAVGVVALGGALIGLSVILSAVGTIIGAWTGFLAILALPATPIVAAVLGVAASIAALGIAITTFSGKWGEFGRSVKSFANEAVANLETVLHFMMSDQWESAASVMYLSIAKGLSPLAKMGFFGVGGAALGFGKLGVDEALKEARDAAARAKAIDEQWRLRRDKQAPGLPNLADALGAAGAVVRPALGFLNAGQARFFGSETQFGLQQRQLRQLELIREELRQLGPRMAVRFR